MDDTSTLMPTIVADVNYIVRKTQRPYMYTVEPPAGAKRSNIPIDTCAIPIFNARPMTSAPSLEVAGFMLLRHRSAMRDFLNSDEVRRVYYPETERMLVAATGAAQAIVFDHTVRRRIPGAEDRRHPFRQPVQLVHVDYSAVSGRIRAQQIRGENPGDLFLGQFGHIQIVNVWRSVHDALRDAPLAVCDVRTVDAADYIPADLFYTSGPGEVLLLAHNPAHRWFYFHEMNSDEILIFKCYDSRDDCSARFTPHTSFVDPTTPPDSQLRESIELRVVLVYT